MSEYTELLNALHKCSVDSECAGCPYWHDDGTYCDQGQLARDAAAAIETLERQVGNLERALRRDGEWQSTRN